MIDHCSVEEKAPQWSQATQTKNEGFVIQERLFKASSKPDKILFLSRLSLSLSLLWQSCSTDVHIYLFSKKFVHARPNNLRYQLSQNYSLLSIKRDDPCPQFCPKGMCTSKELFPSYKPFQIRIGIRKYVFLFSKPGNGIEGLKIRG